MYNTKDLEFTELDIQYAIDQVLRGNPDAFETLYDAYYKMVISIIRRIIKPPLSELDSLVNEAFLLIYKGLKGFKGNSKFSTYAYRIVLNYSFRISKRISNDKKNFIIFGENNEGIENIPSSQSTEDDMVIQNFLDNAIGTLNKNMQEAIDLYYYNRHSIKEIAEIVGTTETAVKNRLYQARNKIKALLPKGVYHA